MSKETRKVVGTDYWWREARIGVVISLSHGIAPEDETGTEDVDRWRGAVDQETRARE